MVADVYGGSGRSARRGQGEVWRRDRRSIREEHGGHAKLSTFAVLGGVGRPRSAQESLDRSMAEMLILRSEKEEGQGKRSRLQLNTNG